MSASPQRHEMVHKGTDSSGAQEWLCQECGRHFVVRWPPHFDRLVLQEGDGTAEHFGRMGDVALQSVQVSPPSGERPNEPSAADENAWRRWLRQNGIDWDGWVA
ncbi:MAG TPA: hypothetical protein VGC06_06905 [Actinomycetes bacterium]